MHAVGSQSWEPGDSAVAKQRSAVAVAEQPETWQDAEVVMEALVPVRQWQPGGSGPADEEGLGTGAQQKLVERRLSNGIGAK